MTGVKLSRWSMAYFAAALLALLVGEALMVAGYGYPYADARAPETLVLVHLLAIGWLSLLLCGALFQFVPVLIARPLHDDLLPLPALALLIGGLGALLAGFLQLAGTLQAPLALLPAGALLLAAGFGLVLYDLGRTLLQARPLPLPARFVLVALLSLVAAVFFGVLLSLALSLPIAAGWVTAIAPAGLPLHIVAALVGWLSFAAIGVSYRLLAMFMLAPELAGPKQAAVFWLGTVALAVAILGGCILLEARLQAFPALLIALVPGLAGLALYLGDAVRLYRERKRRAIELNSQMAALALVSLAATAVLLLVLIVLGRLQEQAGALVFLVAFGWLTGLGLAKLYKIVAFLTWLECYGPVLGKVATPRVQDLVVEPRARPWFAAYYLAVWAATAALLAAWPAIFRMAALVMLLATFMITVQIARTRRLSDAARAMPLPEGVCRPHLLYAASGPNS